MEKFLVDLFENLSDYLITVFTDWEFSREDAETFKSIINMFLIVCVCALSWVIAKWIIIEMVHRIVIRTDNKYDDELVRFKVVEPLSQIFPALYLSYLIKFAISDGDWVSGIRMLCHIWNVFSVVLILFRAIDCLQAIVDQILEEQHRKFSTQGYKQVVKIIVGVIGGLTMIAIFTKKEIWDVLAGLGAMSAILMLVFKDSLSGFVASIQLSSLNMVKMNDWIRINSRNIDGHVVDITLNTVKVRNFDNSVSTVPTAALMNESFINFSNMQEMHARRMMRTIMIDADSVKAVSPELFEKLNSMFSGLPRWKDYVDKRIAESKNPSDNMTDFTKREVSNLELFRKYIEFYIRANYQEFVKYKPVSETDANGNISQVYYVDKDEFTRIHGLSAVGEFLSEKDGKWIISDFRNFVRKNSDLNYSRNYAKLDETKRKDLLERVFLEGDVKDNGTYYPFRYRRKDMFINNELKDWIYPARFVKKDGTFVENGHLMVRQMQQTATGIPLEVYAFTKITEWASFEIVQSEFFEHLFTVIKEFELRTFQFTKTEDYERITTK
jgi:miniconductance mechanosensitive channel